MSESSTSHADRQAIMYCPYCAEETLFPLERGWECRSCYRAFSVAFLGLVSRDRAPHADTREHAL
jgi:ribosomal protein L37AE/L43A